MPLDNTPIINEFYDAQQKAYARENVAENVGVNPVQAAKDLADSQMMGIPLPTTPESVEEFNRRRAVYQADRYLASPTVRDLLADRDMSRLIANTPTDWDRLTTAEQVAQAWEQGRVISRVTDAVRRAQAWIRGEEEGTPNPVDYLYGEDVNDPTFDFLRKWGTKADSPIMAEARERIQAEEARREADARYAPEEIAQGQRELNALSENASLAQIANSDSLLESIGTTLANPIDVIGGTMVSSAAVSPVKMALAPVAGALGGPLAAAALLGSASFEGEFGNTFMSELQKAGVDLSDPDSIRSALKDNTIQQKAFQAAATRALVVSGVDAASVLAGGIQLRPVSAVNRIRQYLRNQKINADVAAHPTPVMPAGTGSARLMQRMPEPYQSPIQPIPDVSARTKIWEDLVSQGVLQSALGAGGEALGSLAIGDDVNASDVFLEAVAELGTAPLDVVSARAQTKNLVQDTVRAIRSRETGEARDNIIQQVQQTQVAQSSPHVVRRIVDKLVANAPALQRVTFNVDELADKGDALAQALPGIKKQILEAQATGGSLSIPLGEYARLSLTNPEVYALLHDVARDGADGMTMAEVEEAEKSFGAGFRESAMKLMNTAFKGGERRAQNTQAIRERLRPVGDALLKLGLSTDEVNKSIAIQASLAESMGDLLGMSPEEVLTKAGPRVEVRAPEEIKGFHQTVDDRDAREAAKARRESLKNVEGAKSILGNFDPDLNLITLVNDPRTNVSTYLHESAHVWLNYMMRTAYAILNRPQTANGAPNLTKGEQKFIDLVGDFMKWGGAYKPASEELGVAVNNWLNASIDSQRAFQEKFAEGFTDYLAQGKAPSKTLEAVFRKFKQWLKVAWINMRRQGQELPPEVAELYDRLFVSESAVEEAQMRFADAGAYDALIKQGLSEDDFRVFADLRDQVNDFAESKVLAAMDRDQKMMGSKAYREARGLEAEFREMVKNRLDLIMEGDKEIRTLKAFTASGVETKNGVIKIKLDSRTLEKVPAQQRDWLRRKKFTAAPGRSGFYYASPEGAAQMLGYDSAQALFTALRRADARNPRAEATRAAEKDFELRFGEAHTPDGVSRIAAKAIYGDTRLRILATEAMALAGRLKDSKTFYEMVKAMAKDNVAKRVYAKKSPKGRWSPQSSAKAFADAKRQSNNAFKLFGKGKNTEAAAAKQSQGILEALGNEVDAANARVEKFAKRVVKGVKSKTMDGAYHEQIRGFAYMLGFNAHRTASTTAWPEFLENHTEMRSAWNQLPESLQATLLAASRTEWQGLTYGDIDALDKFFTALIKQGQAETQQKKKSARAKAIAAQNEIKEGMDKTVKATGRKEKPELPPATTSWERIKQVAGNFFWEHIRGSAVCEMIDGATQGAATRLLAWTADKCGNLETKLSVAWSKELVDALGGEFKGMNKTWFEIPGLPYQGGRINLQHALMIALNMGNEGNLKRLTNMGITSELQAQVVSKLTAKQLQAVQKVWDLFEKARVEAAALERRTNGTEPDWAEPTPFAVTSADGVQVELKGGYIPIRYDPHQVGTAAQKLKSLQEQEQTDVAAGFTGSTTLRTYTKPRAEEGPGLKLDLSFDVVVNGLQEVCYDICWREWIDSTNAILRDQTEYVDDVDADGKPTKKKVVHEGILSYVQRYYGEGPANVLKDWVKNIATEGRAYPATSFDQTINYVRQGVSISGLGFNVVSALVQVTGLIVAVPKVGASYLLGGVNDMLFSPSKTWKEISNRSQLMQYRQVTRFRELADARARIANDGPFGKYTDKIYDWAYAPMLLVQGVVDRIVWSGAYRKATMELKLGEADAISYADRMVIDTQGSGMIKDSAAIENHGPLGRIFTSFYSFMGTALSLNTVSLYGEADRGRKIAQLMTTILILPCVEGIIRAGLQPSEESDDDWWKLDDGEKIKAAAGFVAGNGANMLLGQFVIAREVASATQNFFNGDQVFTWRGPSGLRPVSDFATFLGQAGSAIKDGEIDEAFTKAFINSAGSILGFPAAQINRTISGGSAYLEGDTKNPLVWLLGYKKE